MRPIPCPVVPPIPPHTPRATARATRPAACVAALVVALGTAATRGAAQAPTAPQASPIAALVVSAGGDLSGFDDDHDLGRGRSPGLVLRLGYEQRIGGPRSPFALRFEGEHWRSGRTFVQNDAGSPAGPLTFRRTNTLVGGSVLGVWQFPALGAVRPYVLAGGGIVQYSRRSETDPVSVGPGATWQAVLSPTRVTSASYTVGVGANRQVGRVALFAEARVVTLPGLRDRGVTATRWPLTLGARLGF